MKEPDISGRTKVGLVQAGENFGGQYYLPYSVGILQTYARKHLQNYDEFYFLPAVYKRMPLHEMISYFKEIRIVFFSVYLWNSNFSLAAAREIKLSIPDAIIVVGGPQIPQDSLRLETFLRKYQFVDVACFGEGEMPFVQIMENFEEKKWSKVSSIGYMKPDGTFERNYDVQRISKLNEIPSPYLDGIFDPLLQTNRKEAWSAMWETNRGCPFSCAYCAWGNASKKKVYLYDMERLFEELDWFSHNRIEFIFCCDANFGLFTKRDTQIVDRVVENKKRFGYPKAFSVQNTKNASKTIFDLQKKLNSEGLQKGVNLALQSVNQKTLKSVNRSNISPTQFQDLQRIFTIAGIETFSDMILGLPEESYDSFTSGVSNVIEGGQHNRIQFINLTILENTEMGTEEYLEKFDMILQESEIVSHHTRIGTLDTIAETQRLVVGTRSMPKEDWVKTRVFCWMTSLLHFNKLLQVPFIVMNKTEGVKYKGMIEAFAVVDEDFPIISKIVSFFTEKAMLIQSGGTEVVPSKEWLNINWPADEFVFIKLCVENNLLDFYNESKRLITNRLDEFGFSLPQELLDAAINVNFELVKKPFVTKNKRITLSYNILEFYESVLIGRDTSLKRGKFSYTIKRSQDKWHSWLDWCRDVVWYGTKKGSYFYSFN